MKKLLTLLTVLAPLAAPAPAVAAAETVRPPAVAGQFYPADPKALSDMVEGYLKAAPEAAAGDIVALLVPHAGLPFSGPTAAKAFKLLKSGRWDSVIVIGTGHYKGVEGAAIYPGAYSTPEGVVPYDEDLARALAKTSSLITMDAGAHEREHSIEVELPFLSRRLGHFKLVAMVMNTSDPDIAQKVGHALARVLRAKRVLLVASSDQSHYPSAQDADAVDRTTLEALATLDPPYFWLANRFLMNRGIPNLEVSYCGEAAVTAVMSAAKELGANEAKIIEHTNSGDVAGDRGRVVGYAAAAFVRSKGARPRAALELPAAEKKDLLGLARKSISDYLSTGRAPAISLSKNPRFNLPAAVFVTLRSQGRLRGCIGTTSPQESLMESVSHNAVASATADPRFKPLAPAELSEVQIEISILSQAKPVKSYQEIHPGDGVVLDQGGHTGVFLPQVWEQLPAKQGFLEELCSQKAGLPRDCYKNPETHLRVFTVGDFAEQH